MRSPTITRLLTLGFVFLWSGWAFPAAENWELFATSKTTKVYFDRGSVTEAEGYIQYNIRIDYDETRETRDKKYRYRSAINGVAAQCDAKKFAVTSIDLFDDAGGEGRSPASGENFDRGRHRCDP